jgi:hypothetical protein
MSRSKINTDYKVGIIMSKGPISSHRISGSEGLGFESQNADDKRDESGEQEEVKRMKRTRMQSLTRFLP